MGIIFPILTFFISAIPFGYLITKAVKGVDIRQYGSGNIGATNVSRVCGKKWGIVVFILDLLKGFIPVLICNQFYGEFWAGISAVSAVLGHSFTPYLRFKGGRGVAVGLGSFLGIIPAQAGIAFGIWLISLKISRIVSLSSMIASASLPFLCYIFGKSGILIITTGIGAAIVILRHTPNIKRLIKGEEPKIGR